jgi:hypothetical protein
MRLAPIDAISRSSGQGRDLTGSRRSRVRAGWVSCSLSSCSVSTNDARSVAVAALRARDLRELNVEDEAAVLRFWSRRYRELGSLRTQVVCRLHAVLCELRPGGFSKQRTAGQAIQAVDSLMVRGATAQSRLDSPMISSRICSASTRSAAMKQRTARAVAVSSQQAGSAWCPANPRGHRGLAHSPSQGLPVRRSASTLTAAKVISTARCHDRATITAQRASSAHKSVPSSPV